MLHNIYAEMDRLESPFDEIEVDRAHRTGKANKDSNGKWQQPVKEFLHEIGERKF